MGRKRVPLINVGAEIEKILKEYEQDVTADVNRLVPEVAKDAVADLEQKAPKMTGVYAESWDVQTERRGLVTSSVIYANRYQLPHLLEFDHAKRGGGRYKATKTKHIEPVEKDLIDNFEKRLKEVLG